MKKRNQNEMEYSTAIHHSFGVSGFLDNFFTGAFTTRIFFFYEKELYTPVGLVSLAFLIYGIWNMFNDPIIGYFQDKPNKFVKNWGRRFPWYAITAVPYAIAYFIIFTVPSTTSNIAMFSWLLFTICLFDTFYSTWQNSLLALYPVKFRKQKERTKVGALNTFYGLIGIVAGLLVPPLIITYGDIASYILAALFVTILGIIAAIIIIPGMRENKELRDIELASLELMNEMSKKGEKNSFLQTIKVCFKNKNFIVYMMAFLGQIVMQTLMLASLPYWVKYIVGTDNADVETVASSALIIGVLVGIPIWTLIGNRAGNRKAYIYGAGLSSIGLLIFFIFAVNLVNAFIVTTFLGFGISAIWTLLYPAYSDVIDEITLNTGQRQEGLYTGIRTVFGRLPIVIQAIVFGMVHLLTGFNPNAPAGTGTQTELAKWGIRIHMSLVPFIFYVVAFFLVWKYYDLKPDKMASIKEQLKSLGL
jgi:GPH family glycoside/pentoside/hexuronide:cation symporter